MIKIQYAPLQVRDAIKNYTISSDNLYITIAGTIGNAGIIPDKFDGALLTENALKLVLYPLANKNYLLKAINSLQSKLNFKNYLIRLHSRNCQLEALILLWFLYRLITEQKKNSW